MVSDVGEIDLKALAAGNVELLARTISHAENGQLSLQELAEITESASRLAPAQRERIGITGSPGVGKSTLTGALVAQFRGRGGRVGVLAIDPSSVLTGGALLGDRIRMHEHYLDQSVFIRSMSARGHLGGLSKAAPIASDLLAIAGFHPVIIETVGVGQSEVEVMNHVDTTIVVLSPGAGDDVQSAKAGIMEIADIFVINKIDRDMQGAERLRQEILRSQEIANHHDERKWRAPICLVSALDRSGISELVAAISDHGKYLAEKSKNRENQ